MDGCVGVVLHLRPAYGAPFLEYQTNTLLSVHQKSEENVQQLHAESVESEPHKRAHQS